MKEISDKKASPVDDLTDKKCQYDKITYFQFNVNSKYQCLSSQAVTLIGYITLSDRREIVLIADSVILLVNMASIIYQSQHRKTKTLIKRVEVNKNIQYKQI